jgi:hypothetical protein
MQTAKVKSVSYQINFNPCIDEYIINNKQATKTKINIVLKSNK